MDNIFTTEIRLGNEAMQNPSDIATALRKIASRIEDGCDYGNVYDTNGNIVGEFFLQLPEINTEE